MHGNGNMGRLLAVLAAPCLLFAVDSALARPIAVESGRLTTRFLLTGELVAEDALRLSVPNANIWPMQVRWLAEDGVEVAGGETLVEFDDSQLASQIEQLERAVVEARNQLASLEASVRRDQLEAEFRVVEKSAALEKAEIGAALPREPDVGVFLVVRSDFTHRVSAEGNLRATETTKISVPPTVRRRVRLAWIAAEGALLEQGDLVARFDSKTFESNLQEAEADLSSTGYEMARTEADSDIKLGEYDRDSSVADLELGFAERYELTDESIFSRNEIVEGAIDQELAQARLDHAQAMGGIQRELTATELAILEIEKRKANLKIEEARTGLGSLEVRAPHRGLLRLTRSRNGESPTVGGEMWRGQEIGELPALEAMEAEVFVLEADAGGLVEGKPATVVVEAHPETVHAAIISRLEALAKPRFRGSPVQYFGVTLSFETTDLEVMKPGQRVRATLTLDALDAALVVPRQAVFQDGDRFWVYRREGSVFEAVQVEIGASSAALMVIAGGLAEGDVVALSEPPGTESPLDGAPQVVEAEAG